MKYNDYKYNFRDLHSVYFRRAPTIFPNCQNLDDTNFINGERRDFLEGLYLALNCKWINPLFSTYKAERKIYQLSVAKEVGFKIPNTILSNDPKQITNFIKIIATALLNQFVTDYRLQRMEHTQFILLKLKILTGWNRMQFSNLQFLYKIK